MEYDTFFSVDCETSGPLPGRHALLSIGVVAVTSQDGKWSLGDSMYREWAPPAGTEEDPAATRIHGLSLEELRSRGVAATDGARELAEWVLARGSARRVFVGYNAGFDWAFVLYALGAAGIANPFHHAPLDLKSAIWGAHGGAWREHSTFATLEKLVRKPIGALPGEHEHDALDDARVQARAFVELLQYLDVAHTNEDG
jgi:ribonuclease T